MRVLIVEDEILVAMELEETISELGHEVVGIAPDRPTALELARLGVDIALVDINLRDGETGVEIGRRLAGDSGAAVVFVTANDSMVGDGVPGAIGVLPKPVSREAVAGIVSYALTRRLSRAEVALPAPPVGLRLFA